MFIIHGNCFFCKNAGRELRGWIKIYALHNFMHIYLTAVIRNVCAWDADTIKEAAHAQPL